MMLLAALPGGSVPVKVAGCTHTASIRPRQATLELTHDLCNDHNGEAANKLHGVVLHGRAAGHEAVCLADLSAAQVESAVCCACRGQISRVKQSPAF